MMTDVSVAASYLHSVLLCPTKRQVADTITTAAIITAAQMVAGVILENGFGRLAGVRGGGMGDGGIGVVLIAGSAFLVPGASRSIVAYGRDWESRNGLPLPKPTNRPGKDISVRDRLSISKPATEPTPCSFGLKDTMGGGFWRT